MGKEQKKDISGLDKWYKKGLFFKCQACSKCCYGFKGYVFLSKKDIDKISKFLKISKEDFLKKYTRKVLNKIQNKYKYKYKISLKELSNTFECIFLKDKKCQIYKVRPSQCKTYPFWEENLKSKKDWEEKVLRNCIGSHEKTTIYTYQEIEEILNIKCEE